MPTITVEKNIIIEAEASQIFGNINNLAKWKDWSPWEIAEPDAHYVTNNEGKYHSWNGKIIGAGELIVTDETKDESIAIDLNFIKPWKSKAKTSFALKEEDGKTTVTWTMESTLPFYLFWMKKNAEKFIGMDYMRGLRMLKDKVEHGKSLSKLKFVGEKMFEETYYVGITVTCNIDNMSESMKKHCGQLMSYVMENQKENRKGFPFTIYNKWDAKKNKVTYTTCHPVKEKVTIGLPIGFKCSIANSQKVYSIVHSGPYRHIENAFTVHMMFQRGKVYNPSRKFYPVEVYLNSPTNTPEEKLQSEILFGMK